MTVTVASVVGARPQFIKSGPVSRALTAAGMSETLIHTGQHYDLTMSDIFFARLGLRQPDHHLAVGSGSHGAMTAEMLRKIEEILLRQRPDGVLVYGDTNSTLAGALAAAKLHIPVFHVEAGLRSFNRAMPEEINRVLTDHISGLLFCPTTVAVNHLAAEGITTGVTMVGDVMKDGIDYWLENARSATGLDLPHDLPDAYYLATVHRQENVDVPARLDAIIRAFGRLPRPVVLPIHPRTRAMLDRRGLLGSLPANIVVIEPVGYLEMLHLQAGATALLTDSGGVQKEAYMLGVPCVTLRDETEWVETIETGWNTLAGADEAHIIAAATDASRDHPHPNLYGDGHASDRIAQAIASFVEESA